MNKRVGGWLLGILVVAADATGTLPREPILRIDTGRHTAFIHGLALDEPAGRAYSVSEDKTVRVWRISDGRPLDTFRVPIAARAEGQLYALALSPDRKQLAVGGWTCWDISASACVYLLDANTGAILRRIDGLSEIIASLRFSPDGRHLAVGLMGAQGIRVLRTADWTTAAEDKQYRDKVLELDFTPGGRLITGSLDGFVRLYDERFNLAGRVAAGLAGRAPFGLRCSPDGRRVAVGFVDTAQVSVLNAADLTPVATLVATAPHAPRNLTRVAWSADGSTLYATGEPAIVPGTGALYRWRITDPTRGERLPAASARIGDFVLTREDLLLFGTEEPSLGLLDARAGLRYRIASGVPGFPDARNSLRVSTDGTQVEIALGAPHDSRRRFSVVRGVLEKVDRPSAGLQPSITTTDGWRITRWGAPEGPKINGYPVPLEPYEVASAYSISPRTATLLLGSEWSLRALDSRAAVKWSVRTPTMVRAVAASADGRFAIAALADGTLNWYALRDGTPVLSLFLHADGENWVAWAPSGEYASSAYGDNFVGWHINRGQAQMPDFVRAVQFERELYRPQVIAARLAAFPTASDASASKGAQRLLDIAPPRLRVSLVQTRDGRAGVRHLQVRGESSGLPMLDVAAYVNDIPITPAQARKLRPSESKHVEREFELRLTQPDNDVRVEVFNGSSLGIAEIYVPGPTAPVVPENGADLYVLAVGANVFPSLPRELHLSYAARDAEQFAQAFRPSGSRNLGFRRVHVQTLSDDGRLPLRASILEALQMLTRARGEDTVVVFLASHGLSDSAGNYFFVPRDAQRADLDALLSGKSLPSGSSLIGWSAFFDVLRNTAGRRLLIVDTCQARNISGSFQEHSLVKRSASSRIAFVLASRGDEESQEYPRGGHGLFTFALLAGLDGNADADGDGTTTVAEWFNAAADLVERLRDRRIGPQTPQFIAPRTLQMMPIVKTSPRLSIR